MERKTIQYNELFILMVSLFDGEFNLANRVSAALTKHGFKFDKTFIKDSVRYGGEYHFVIECDGVSQLAVAFVIMGGMPDK